MSSKLVFSTQRDWLAGHLGFWLMPSYSVAKEAANLVSGWADDAKDDARRLKLGGSTLRCYLPVTDETAYEAHLAAEEKQLQHLRSRMRG